MRKKKGAKNREKAKGSLEEFSEKARLRSKRPRRRSIGGSPLLLRKRKGAKNREKAKGSLEEFSEKARLRSKRPRRRSIGGSPLL